MQQLFILLSKHTTVNITLSSNWRSYKLSISFRYPDKNEFPFNAILASYQSHLIFDVIVFRFGEYENFEGPHFVGLIFCTIHMFPLS